ncbi:hypothetical protein [Mesomycoplasma conjunctivae]|uniref:hypothetical protein n=1 Tax=Mesomycoplasma conjunctivae TaxID=45361 RepID=UPI003DA391A0
MIEINFSYYGIFIFLMVILLQFFIFFIYQVNLKIKYSNLATPFKINIDEIRKTLNKKYHLTFDFKLTNEILFDHISFKNMIIKIPEAYLDESAYGQINLLFFHYFYLNNSKFKLKYNKVLFTTFLIFFHIFIILLTMSLYWISIIFLVISLILLSLDFVLNHKIFWQSFKDCSTFIEAFQDGENYLLMKSYLKYKKIAFWKRYFIFYPLWTKNMVVAFSKWGK